MHIKKVTCKTKSFVITMLQKTFYNLSYVVKVINGMKCMLIVALEKAYKAIGNTLLKKVANNKVTTL